MRSSGSVGSSSRLRADGSMSRGAAILRDVPRHRRGRARPSRRSVVSRRGGGVGYGKGGSSAPYRPRPARLLPPAAAPQPCARGSAGGTGPQGRPRPPMLTPRRFPEQRRGQGRWPSATPGAASAVKHVPLEGGLALAGAVRWRPPRWERCPRPWGAQTAGPSASVLVWWRPAAICEPWAAVPVTLGRRRWRLAPVVRQLAGAHLVNVSGSLGLTVLCS